MVKVMAQLRSVRANCRKFCVRLPDTSEVSLVLEDKRLQVRAGKEPFQSADVAGR
jgi:hypothetical protein